MYNKTKRTFELAGAVLGIIVGVLFLAMTFIDMPLGNVFGVSAGEGGAIAVSFGGIAVMVVQIIISIFLILICSILCLEPKKDYLGNFSDNLGKKITVLAILAVYFIKYVATLFGAGALGLSGILCIFPVFVALPLIIVSFFLKNETK